jgi:hypothetical protein
MKYLFAAKIHNCEFFFKPQPHIHKQQQKEKAARRAAYLFVAVLI